MHKIASNGATVDNKFTEGNAGLSVPATVVDAFWLNAVQTEIVTVVEGAGLTLEAPSADDGTQLLTAIQTLIAGGGLITPISQAIANNQASAANVTGFPNFDTTIVKTVEFLYDIVRRTDSGRVLESGRGFMTWDSEAPGWRISPLSVFDDAGVTFVATVVSGTNYKLQYQSTNLSGASYSGTLRITDVKKIKA